MNVLPSPTSLRTRISPPSRRAISRLIDRPRPVPPYLRPVPVSACWNGSKMTRSLSGGMPMPVSLTANATTRPARPRTGWSAAPAARGQPDVQADPAALGELEGVRQEVPQHLLQPLRVGGDGPRQLVVDRDVQDRGPCVSATGRKVRSTYSRRSANGSSPTSIAIVPDSIFAMSRMSLISDEQVGARGVDRLGELALLGGQVPFGVVGEHLGQDQQAVERRAQLVRHVRQELALVLGGQGELLGLLLQLLLGQLDLPVLGLDMRLLHAELLRLGLQLLVGPLQRVLLLPEQFLRLLERGRLLLQPGVGLAQLHLLVLAAPRPATATA